MLTVEYMHICDYAFQAQGGKPSIVGIFDNINAGQFPAAHPLMCIAIQFVGPAHSPAKVRVELGRPNGDVIAGIDADIAMSAEGQAFVNLNLMGVQFPEAGRYTVKVSSQGQTLASKSLLLKVVRPPQGAPVGVAH